VTANPARPRLLPSVKELRAVAEPRSLECEDDARGGRHPVGAAGDHDPAVVGDAELLEACAEVGAVGEFEHDAGARVFDRDVLEGDEPGAGDVPRGIILLGPHLQDHELRVIE
jgi:hypothetical protein